MISEDRVKTLAHDVGFDLVGIASAAAPPALDHFQPWVEAGHAGEMSYLTEQVDRRRDLTTAFPWARTVISVGVQYDTPAPYSTEAPDDRGWIARYAWGDDYHEVIEAMLDRLQVLLVAEMGPFRARRYADTGPVVERAYAQAAGLGAWGKNTCLLHPEHGSWFFLGEIVTDLALAPDLPRADMCGTCTACIDACPTDALRAPYVLDARRCISYLTIELRGAVPLERRPGIGKQVFGCDICQDVCPWNRRRRKTGAASFTARPGLQAPDLGELAALDPAQFAERFRRNPVKRAKRRGLLRNVAIAMGNAGDERHRPALERLATDEDPLVREHARWALDRLRARSGT